MIGLGIDLCQISRMAAILEKQPAFLKRYFSEAEIAYIHRQEACAAQSAAAMLAAKEAFAKAVGTGFAQGVSARDIHVLHRENGCPYYEIVGESLEKMRMMGARRCHLSLTHEGDMAAAVCILD